LFAGRERTARVLRFGGMTMGTSWSVRLAAPLGGMADDLEQGIRAVLDGVIAQMSNWEPASDISRFNTTPPDEWQTLPDDFLFVLDAALRVASTSGGAFDPTVGRAVDLWGFGPGAARAPAPRRHNRPGDWRAIEIGRSKARRLSDVTLDFSGIAKGFAVDAVASLLTRSGLRHALVEIGGELRGEGVRPDGQPWWVDVELPEGLTPPGMRVALSGLSIATSGDYRRWFEEGGRRFAHSIDPRTGAPVENDVASVTVLHESAMMADAWATAILVSGREKGMALAEREGLAVLTIERAPGGARETMSTALHAMLE
jgi:thiamine biosynthesis lipoprotein